MLKHLEVGDIISPLDTFISKNVYNDEKLENYVGEPHNFTKKDNFEIQIVTPQELVAKVNNLYVVLQNYDLSEFENIN
jgi:hypothetical protein